MKYPRLLFVMTPRPDSSKLSTALYIIYSESRAMYNGYRQPGDEWVRSLLSVAELEEFVRGELAIELEWP